MMTEEQKQALIQHAIKLKSARNIYGSDIHEIRSLADFALAALTQPVSPDLKLPDAPPNALVALCEQMYDHRSTGVTVAHDVWQDCIEELLMDAPHTAPIEPICATGGAEWVKCSERMPDDDTLCLGIDTDGVIWTMHFDGGELMTDTGFVEGLEITHWMPLPTAPEAE